MTGYHDDKECKQYCKKYEDKFGQKLPDCQFKDNQSKIQNLIRKVNPARNWINEKYEPLCIEDLGKELRSVQALQGKQEVVERDLAALGQKIQNMDEAADKLSKDHPEALKEITERKKAEITKDGKQLNSVATAHKEKLLDSYDFMRFLSDFRDLKAWIANMKSLISNEEMARNVTVAEALLEQHQEHRTEIGKKSQWLKI